LEALLRIVTTLQRKSDTVAYKNPKSAKIKNGLWSRDVKSNTSGTFQGHSYIQAASIYRIFRALASKQKSKAGTDTTLPLKKLTTLVHEGQTIRESCSKNCPKP
jgi:hypothetical protein